MSNVKHKLSVMLVYPGDGEMPRELVKELCTDAKAEIERLEALNSLAVSWLKIMAKGENLTTVCDEPITMMTAETLRNMAASTLKRLYPK